MNEPEKKHSTIPFSDYHELDDQYAKAYRLVDDIVLKNYITKLSGMELVPLDADIKTNNISENVRIFKINEMIYQKDEFASYKFASVFNSVANLGCSVFVIINSDGDKTEFYMGIRSLNSRRTTSSLKDTLKNALLGQFPGIKIQDYLNSETKEILGKIDGSSIAISTSVAENKNQDITENKSFLQGLEKLAISMQGQKYTGVVIANGTSSEQLQIIKNGYENIYTQLSPFAEMQINFGENEAYNISRAFSEGETKGDSYSKNFSSTKGTSDAHTTGTNHSETEESKLSKALGVVSTIGANVASLAIAAASIGLAPVTGGLSLAGIGAAGGLAGVAAGLAKKQITHGTNESDAHTAQQSITTGETQGGHKDISKTETDTRGITTGASKSLQLTRKNKTIIEILERIDLQLKRIKEFESFGMWECSAYFISDNQYSAEIAASTYKALMRGEDSGVEVSAVTAWGSNSGNKVSILKDYIKNFIHPVFMYETGSATVPVNACSFVSGNELAIHMGMPRKSISGFPVIEHAEFGKDILRYSASSPTGDITLGKIYDMGLEQKNSVRLGRKSLTMHTFITGSTGSGKSNTIYKMIGSLDVVDIPFLVIEPAKGEYKNVFGNKANVAVYGTNPDLTPLLRINPFKFENGIHVLEHLDRLIEIFNVCWPMYAAMPAILKNAVEKSYEEAGWDLKKSASRFNPSLYPSFADVVKNIKRILDSSEYSDENKGTYKGALTTRLESLANGLNGLIFTNDELSSADLFDGNVIADLSRIGSMETKALIMGILIMKLHEYRMTNGEMNSDLKHVTVLEEAHNLLKRTSTEQSNESSNLIGKSVEMLANAIAEMRTFGEGFIIADQAPGLLDMSVIRNTNTKIILRLPDQTDRELVGKAAGLNDDQIVEIAKLQCGVAAVYQNDWIQPVLCKVEHYKAPSTPYKFDCEMMNQKINDDSEFFELKKRITRYLLSGMIHDPPKENVDSLKEAVLYSNLATGLKTKIADFIGCCQNPPEIINSISDMVAGLYDYSGKALEKLDNIGANNIDHAWAKELFDEVTPRIDCFTTETQMIIMNCIVTEISYKNKTLQDLPGKWAELGRRG
jgi:hypothetical protein